ncbi:unnamed protein product [Sympodiomycopsis kandeliae]
MADDNLQDQVQQEGVASSLPTRAHQDVGTSKKRKRQSSSIDVDRYQSWYFKASEQFYNHLHDADHRWLRSTPSDTGERLAPQEWSAEDVTLFFRSLARRSRWRPDLISSDLGGRKSSVQVASYIDQLSQASGLVPSLRDSGGHPAAREVSEEWLDFEERYALKLQGAQDEKDKRLAHDTQEKEPDAKDSSDDQKVCNAVLFLQSHRGKSDPSRCCQVSKAKDSAQMASLPTLTFSELSNVMQLNTSASSREREIPRQTYQLFGSDHLLPDLHPRKSPGRPKKIKRKSRANEDPRDADSAPIVGTLRILVRAVELGLLFPIQQIDHATTGDGNGESRYILRQDGNIYRGRKRIKSTQVTPLPLELLDEIKVVFVADLAKSSLFDSSKQNLIQHGVALMKLTSEEALRRILQSVTEKELIWLSEESAPMEERAHNNSPNTQKGGRKITTEFRGYSLVGMSAEERKQFKARIRSREAKHGPDQTIVGSSPFSAIPREARWQGYNGERTQQWNNGKSKILDIFKEVLDLLGTEEKEAEKRRLKKSARKFGTAKVVEREMKALQKGARYGGFNQELVTGLERGIKSVEEAEAAQHVHGNLQGEVMAEIDGDGEVEVAVSSQMTQKSGPSLTTSHHSSGGERFHAIGHTKTSVRSFLDVGEEGDLFNLKTIASYLSASVMTSCTRPDESDSLIDQETPNRLNYQDTILRLRTELCTFLSNTMSAALSAAENQGASQKIVELKHVQYALGFHEDTDLPFASDGKAQGSSHGAAPSSGPAAEFCDEEDEDSDSDTLNLAPLICAQRPTERSLEDDHSLKDENEESARQVNGSDDDDDEMFESHYEAAQVAAVRSQWGSVPLQGKASSHFSLLGGFYWPTATIVQDIGDLLSASDDELQNEAESFVDSEDEMDEKDRQNDLKYEQVEWKNWFGEDREREEIVVETDSGAQSGGDGDDDEGGGSE